MPRSSPYSRREASVTRRIEKQEKKRGARRYVVSVLNRSKSLLDARNFFTKILKGVAVDDFKTRKELKLPNSTFPSLPERTGDLFKSLTVLELPGCKSLVSLPDSIGDLKSLNKLDLSYCKKLESLPDSICDLTSLTELKLAGCENLTSLPERFGELPALAKVSLPTGLGDKEATYVILSRISALTLFTFDTPATWGLKVGPSLPESFAKLVSIDKETFMATIKHVKRLPENIVEHPHLRDATNLDLSWAQLVKLPERIGDLTSLTKLNLSYCENLHYIPERIGDLKSLTKLNLRGCKELDYLPDGIADLTSLKELNLRECRELHFLPERLGEVTKKPFVYIGGSQIKRNMPDHLREQLRKRLFR